MTLAERLAWARGCLTDAGIPRHEATQDAELLARRVLGWTRTQLLAERESPAADAFLTEYDRLIARRVAREPIAYILGRQAFWTFDAAVTPAVLIPRPETELVVEEALASLAPDRIGARGEAPVIIDAGTGSGCIAIALALEAPAATIIATDLSSDALAVARANAERCGVGARITFVETDMLAGLTHGADLIVSNPPYVPTIDEPMLAPEVRDHEPRLALFAGADGLDVIRRLIAEAPHHLRNGGRLIFECGSGQDEAIREIVARTRRLDLEHVRSDLQNIPRVFVTKLS